MSDRNPTLTSTTGLNRLGTVVTPNSERLVRWDLVGWGFANRQATVNRHSKMIVGSAIDRNRTVAHVTPDRIATEDALTFAISVFRPEACEIVAAFLCLAASR